LRAKEIARRRIEKLIKLAFSERRKDLARRYIQLSKKIAMRLRVKIPKRFKLFICKKCLVPLIPGRNAIFRVEKGVLKIICKECGHVRRIPYKP